MMICFTETTEAMPTSLRGGRRSSSSIQEEEEEEDTDSPTQLPTFAPTFAPSFSDDDLSDDEIQDQRKEEEIIISCDDQPNTTPFRFELGVDSFGHETTWVLTMNTNDDEPDRIIGEVDDEEKYQPNSQNVEYLCLPKNAQFTFTIFDEHGDGLRIEEGAYYRGIIGDTDGNDNDEVVAFTMPDGEWSDLSHTFNTISTKYQDLSI